MHFQQFLANNHNKNNLKINLLWYLTITFLLSFFFQNIKSTSAQITPDSTLGNENSIVTPNTEINGKLGDLIEGGATRGNNLFHSFSDFNINEGNAAYFANPTAIQNIFSRVTGGNPSHLFGTLGVLGNANLFFINPNGIFLGQNASLDIRGTFVGSTANELIFPDGNRFSAINPQGMPLLSINVQPTIGLQFGNDAGSIINAADLNSNGTITLVGNSVVSRGNISAPQINLTAVGNENILVDLDTSGKIFNITNPHQNIFSSSSENTTNSKNLLQDNLQLSDTELLSLGISVNELGEVILNDSGLPIKSGNVIISPLDINIGLQAEKAIIINSQEDFLLTNGVMDVTGNQGGSININAKNIKISNSEILAGIGEELGFEGANSGDINLNVTENLELKNSLIANNVNENALGNSGKIVITAEDILINNSEITTDIWGKGNSGGVFLDTSNLLINNAGQISSNIEGEGKAGRIQINANEDITIDGKGSMSFSSRIVSEIKSGARGNTEGIEINTFNLSLLNGGLIFTQTLGEGDAGDIKIKASEDITLDGETLIFADGFIILSFSGIASTSSSKTGGNSGTIEIDTSNLFLLNGGQISTNTNAKGNAGILQIKASENITIDGESKITSFPSGITNQITPPAEGNSGKIFINTTNLSLTNGGQISTSTFGKGNAGGVQINAKDIMIDGETSKGDPSSIFSQVNEDALGNSEGTFIDTNTLSITNGGQISSSSLGEGDAGKIQIKASEGVFLSGTIFDKDLKREIGGILAFTLNTGKAGNIIINTPQLIISEGSGIETFTSGKGNAGSITINAHNNIILNAGTKLIVESSGAGIAGDIDIYTPQLTISENAQLSATATKTSTSPTAGKINLNVNQLDISGKLGIFAETQSIADAGNLTIQPYQDNPNLNIKFTDEGFISARTTNIGDGGSIFIFSPENINIQGNGSITVEATGTGKAGNINITSKRLSLDESNIIAQTFSTDGGNIILNIPVLLTLRNGSNITATAGTAQAGGNGGNITITTSFIIAVPSENSDITANAFLGNGGNINITANAIFGLQERNQVTILSDITASSEFGLQGNININTAGIDPVRGLQDLPETEVNTEIAIGCQVGVQKDTSSFKIDGSGGFPSNPQQNLELDIFIDNGEINNFIQDWDSFNESSPQNQSHRFFNNSSELVNINEGIIFFSTNFSCN